MTFTLVDVQISIISHHTQKLLREWVSYTHSVTKQMPATRVAHKMLSRNKCGYKYCYTKLGDECSYVYVDVYLVCFRRKQKFEQIVQFRVIKCGSTLLTLFMRKFFSFRVFYLQ